MRGMSASILAILLSSSRPAASWTRGLRTRGRRRLAPPVALRTWPEFAVGGLKRLTLGAGEAEEFEFGDSETLLQEIQSRVGNIALRNTQRSFNVDDQRLARSVKICMDILDCGSWDVSIWLTTDRTVSKLNGAYRGKQKSTDILSFPLHDIRKAGVLPEVHSPEEMELGEMIISLAYVNRQMERDALQANVSLGSAEDRGVSGAMAASKDLDERLELLCVHGLLHLLGHDHETEEEYLAMVEEEERVIYELKKRRNSS